MPLVLSSARLVGTNHDLVDVTVDRGRVAAITPAGAASGRVERIDLDGRFLGPSMRDAHVHFSQYAMLRQRVDLSAASSAADAADIVRRHAGSTTPLVGSGFRDGLWPDAPHRDLLDAVSLDQEIVLVSADLHCVWLNSAALARHGRTGHPSGLLREQEAVEITTALGRLDGPVLDEWVGQAAASAARRGVTEIVELEWASNIDNWTRRVQNGLRALRVITGVYPDDLDDVIGRGLRTGDTIADTDGLVRMGPLKIITDGSLNTRTAYCHDPYPGLEHDTHPRGIAQYTPRGLRKLMRRAHASGLVPAVHAIGDAANALTLDAFAEVGCRGTVEHAQLVAREDIRRFAELGLVASIQPEHALDDRDIAERHWPGRTDRSFAFGALAAAGVEISLGSDAPVAPLDPWITLAAAIFRARDGRTPWHPENRLAPLEAYRSSTTGRRTRVRVGDVADLVATERDPLTADNDELRALPVTVTLLEGRPTFSAL